MSRQSRNVRGGFVQKYIIALCGLTARDQRLLEMLLSRPSSSHFQFHATDSKFANNPAIAIVDTASPLSLSTFNFLLIRHRHIVPVVIVDNESAPANSRYVVLRSSLMRTIFRVLGELVDAEFAKGKVVPQPPSESDSNGNRLQAAAELSSTKEAAFVDGSSAIPEPLRALVIDDSLAVREQLRAGLDRLGFRCDQACDAVQAQGMLAGGTYDLALLDVVMPGMDGYELCRKIKQDPYKRKMPVVMLTSRSSPFDRARGALSGCDSYLTKPITWDEFRVAVDRALLKSAHNDRSKLASRGYAAVAQST